MLTAQLAFVHQLQGDGGKAMKTYTALFNFKTELDPVVAAVAGNNIVALRGGKSGQLFDSWKKCRANLSGRSRRRRRRGSATPFSSTPRCSRCT